MYLYKHTAEVDFPTWLLNTSGQGGSSYPSTGQDCTAHPPLSPRSDKHIIPTPMHLLPPSTPIFTTGMPDYTSPLRYLSESRGPTCSPTQR